MLGKCVILAAAVLATGCATVVNESVQPIKVETKTATGELVAGAECELTNDHGKVSVKSGNTVEVRRSGSDLDIVCRHPDNPDAIARAVSRANAGMFGNIIIGGAVGAIIDHSKGTAYSYPTWVQLVFGKIMAFDRNAQKDGEPVVGSVSGDSVAKSPSTQEPAQPTRNSGPVSMDDLRGLLPPAQR